MRSAALLFSAASLWGQSSVQVTADSSKIASGLTLKASALARDTAGNPMNVAFRWTSSGDAVASVS